jgi:concanavalin A-like lectin/glucanase superfamily protein
MLKRSILVALCVLVTGPAFSAMAGLDPSLVGWWSFDEGAGTVALDGSGNGNDGVLNGDPSWVAGQLGGALDFTGTNSNVAAPHIPLDNRSFTIALWVNLGQNNAEHIAFSQGPGSTNNGLHLRLGGSGNPAAGGLNFGFYANDLVTGGGILELDTWYHLGFVYDIDAQQKRIYVDGELVDEGASTPFLGTTQDTIIGSWNDGQWFEGMIDDVQLYHRALADAEVAKIMTGLADQSLSQNPSPASEATDIPRDVVLGWDAGEFAATHDVYLGTSLDDVNAGAGTLVSQGQTATSLDPDGLLEFGQTYYWRVDEVNAAPDNTVFTGEIWSFSVEPFAYAVENVIATTNGVSGDGVGIENTINGSGLNADDQHSTGAADMWLATPGADPLQVQYELGAVYKLDEMLVWNYNVQFEPMLGFGLKDVTIEYSENGTDWMVLGDVELAQATARSDYAANTAVDFGGVAVKSVRLTVNSGHGPLGQFGLSEVRFMYIPALAREPQPAAGDTGVAAGTTLSWRAGREAVTHDVYLSTDPEALALIDSTSDTSSTPGDLEFGSTYYWRIDEVNEADDISVWPGMVWDFMTEEFAVIDDMESYNDEDNVIYETWIDGWVNETGSTVGYLQAPFAEKTVVNGGLQSMPLAYDNSASPFYSEAETDLGGANWNSNGADSLRLFVSGLAPAFAENADGTVLMNGIGADIWGTGDQFRYAYKSLTGDGSMIARVDSLDNSPSTWAKAGVMIRQGIGTGSQHSMMCMTGGDGNGASWQGRVSAGLDSVNADATDPVAPPYWVKIERSGNTLTGSLSADGETWTQLGDPREVQMDDPVLIGLALTSHLATQATSAQFSNVSFTGSVSGAWTVEEIGVAQPEGNMPQPIYVAVEDSAGKVAVVTHPDAAATARSGWTEWLIPYSDLAGVNLNSVSTIYVGVGDRDNPSAGGTGTVFVDDLGYGRPVPVVESE